MYAINVNRLCQKVIDLEIGNVRVAFDILNPNKSATIGWKAFRDHLVYDIRMDFTRNDKRMKNGHKTSELDQSTYAGVILRGNV